MVIIPLVKLRDFLLKTIPIITFVKISGGDGVEEGREGERRKNSLGVEA